MFSNLLQRYQERFGFRLYHYCLMKEEKGDAARFESDIVPQTSCVPFFFSFFFSRQGM